MPDLPEDLLARRDVEDELSRLGSERDRIENEAGKNISAIVAMIPDAIEAGIPFDGIARLVGVSRQTLYRWQAVSARLRGAERPPPDDES